MRSPGRRAHSFRDLLIETKSSMLFLVEASISMMKSRSSLLLWHRVALQRYKQAPNRQECAFSHRRTKKHIINKTVESGSISKTFWQKR